VIIEDSELESMDAEDAAEAASDEVNAVKARRDASLSNTLPNQDPAFELGKPIDPSRPERWYDVEAGCYIDEELPPGLGPMVQEGVTTSTPTQDHCPSLYHDSRNTQCTLEEPAPRSLPELLDKDYGGEGYDNVSELERDLLLAFEELEESSLATAPNFPQSHRRNIEQSHPRIDQEYEQGRTSSSSLEGFGHGSPLPNQDQDQEEEEFYVQQQEQQQQEVAANAIWERVDNSNGDDRQQPEKQGEKRRRQDGTEEVSSDIHLPEGSNCSHNKTNEHAEEEEDDEEPRPAKRRKMSTAPTHKAPTPPLNYNSMAHFRQPHSITPPLVTQLEINDTQPQVHLGNSPIPVDDEHYIPQTPRSPSAPTESITIAKYQEWPFQGFVKRTKIGNDTTYNLEFKLACISEALNLPINLEVLDICSNMEAPSKVAMPHKASAHSKIYSTGLRPQIKRDRWKTEEDTTVLQMRNDGCSWKDIHAVLPHRSIGTIQVRYSTKLKR
jgi:hypothetical protein